MELKTNITNLYIESDKGQTGDALKREWNTPFNFNIIARFACTADYYSEWDDYYSFICQVRCENNPNAIIKFRGQNKRCGNPCRMRVLGGNSFPMAVFECRVETPGKYIVNVNGIETSFMVI